MKVLGTTQKKKQTNITKKKHTEIVETCQIYKENCFLFFKFQIKFSPLTQAVNTNTRNRSLGRLRRQPPRHGIGKFLKTTKEFIILVAFNLQTC